MYLWCISVTQIVKEVEHDYRGHFYDLQGGKFF